MSVVIVGAGEMGYHLARRLSYEKRDVVVVDRSAERVNHVHENLDVKALVGRGSSPAVLREAGIRNAAILVAVTDSDEVNLMACYVGGALNGFMTKVARLRHEDFSEFPEILDKKHLNLDLVISPENEAVKKLMQVIEVPGATDFIEFAEGRIKLFGIRLRDDSPFVGQSMIDLRKRFPNDRLLIPVIFRDSEVIIPKGHVVLRKYDTIYVIAPAEDVPRLIEVAGIRNKPMKSFMILGGTPTAVKVARELEKLGASSIRLVESDAARCEEIAAEVDYTMVLKCESVDEEFLRSEGVADMDAFLALTDDDENNALTALLAKRMGADRVAALTTKLEYHRLISAIGVDVAINPRLAGASRILQYIRKGKIISVSMLPGEGVEAIEIEAMATSQIVGTPLEKVRFPAGAILGAVERNRQFFIPHGETVVEPGDRVIVFVRREAIPKLEKLVTVRLEYF